MDRKAAFAAWDKHLASLQHTAAQYDDATRAVVASCQPTRDDNYSLEDACAYPIAWASLASSRSQWQMIISTGWAINSRLLRYTPIE